MHDLHRRTPRQIAKDKASYLLDLVVAEPTEYSWSSIRETLAELYDEAGMSSISQFVKGRAES